ncbi:unnamed protein product [Leuciscus chuanchicus]
MCAPLHRHVKCTAFVPMTLRQVTLCQSPENSDCAIGPCHAKTAPQLCWDLVTHVTPLVYESYKSALSLSTVSACV